MNLISKLFKKHTETSENKKTENKTRYGHSVALEPRFMFDAAGAVTAVDVATEQVVDAQVNAFISDKFLSEDQTFPNSETVLSDDESRVVDTPLPAASNRADEEGNETVNNDDIVVNSNDDSTDNTRVEIAFIDLGIDNADQLAAALDPNIEVIFIDPEKGGIEQIADVLADRVDIDAIHILSHGEQGTLSIAGTEVTADSIKGEQAALFTLIGQSLSEDGDMLIYGCNFAEGEAGGEAIDALANITKADIAASDDITGAESQGGDWDLEIHKGEITHAAISADDYSGTLATTTPVNTIGAQTGEYVVTADGPLTITIRGGDGGNGSGSDGGEGATVTGTFNVTAGQIVRFVVGEAGNPVDEGATASSAGGGGSTGVFIDDILVLVAGAGGGGDDSLLANSPGLGGNNATTGDAGVGVGGGTAGSNGSGGGGTANAAGSGGGGINSAGESGQGVGGGAADLTPSDGVTLVNGGTGDLSGSDGGRGFTGGGGASPSFSGGGGGYSGGGAAGGNGGGGGGGSYIHASAISSNITLGADGGGTESDGGVKLSLEGNAVPEVYLNGEGNLSTAVAWEHNSPANTPSGGNFNSGSVVSAEDEVFGAGINGYYDNTRVDISGADSADLAEARNNNDYVQYGFTTAAIFTNPVDISAIYNADWVETTGYKISIDISSNGFVTSNTLVEDYQATVSSHDYSDNAYYNGVFSNIDKFEITENTDYQLRIYIYDTDGGRVIFDDFQLFTRSTEYNFNNTFTENGSPVAISSPDIDISDEDDTNMESASIVLANPQTEDRLLVNGSAATSGTLASGITYTRTDTIVTLSGSATSEDYMLVIQTIEFENTGDNPGTTTRNIEVTVNDGESNSLVAKAVIDVNPVDDAPIAVDDGPINVTEDVISSGNVLTNDTDADGDNLTVTQFVVSGNGTNYNAGDTASISGVGTLTINSDGSYIFTPTSNYTGSVPNTTYTITDGNSTDTAVLRFNNITAVNDAPVAVDDGPITVTEDIAVNGNVLTNDSDPDGDSLSVTEFVIAGSATVYSAGSTATISGVGTLVINANGSYTFTPVANYSGSIPNSTYTVSDGNSGTGNAILSFNDIVNINDAPIAVDDGPISVTENIPTSGTVLANDSDADGDTLEVTQFLVDGDSTIYSAGTTATITGIGTLVINTNGTYTFTPAPDYSGSVPNTTYTISDGQGSSDIAILSFSNIIDVNEAPLAVDDSSIAVTEDTPSTGNILDNDSDPDGDIITVTQFVVTGDTTIYVAGNTATISGVGSLLINANGTYTFTPEANYNGVIPSVTYTITDGSLTDTAVLNFNDVEPVDDAPEAADDGIYSVTEDTASTGNVLTNDTDVENDTLSVTEFIIDGDATVYSAGDTATIVNVGTLIINANGSFTFTPAENYNGPVPHSTYVVSDGNGGSDTATLTFSDVSPVNDAPVANADNSITVTEDTVASGNVLTNDSDPDGDIITVTQFVVTGDTTIYVAGNTATISGVGSLLINANGTYTFTPEANYNGVIPSVTYTITDGSLTDSAVLNFNNITSVDDAPEAADDGAYSVTEDEASIGNVLTNDTDIENDTLTVTEFVIDGDATVYSAGDTATIVNVGTLIINANGSFTFTPAENYNGPVPHSTYVVSDGNGGSDTATLTFSDVSPVNDAPVANADNSITVTEDTVASGNVLTNDSDPDGDIITVTQFIVAGDATTYSAGDTATISGVGSLLINANGTYTFTPETNYDGAIPDVTYTITDGSLTDSAVLNFNNITSVDDAPEAADDGIYSVTEDTASTGNVLTNDTDVENDTLSVTEFIIDGDATVYSAGDTATIVNVGTLIINANGSFTFTPAENYNGPVPHSTYVVSDGNGGSDTATLTFSDVSPVNDAPVANADNSITVTEDTVASGNVLTNDSDPDGDIITVTQFIVAGDATTYSAGDTATISGVGSLLINANGTYTFTPEANYNGVIPSVTYTITDGSLTDSAVLNFNNITSVDDAPEAADDGIYSVTEDTASTGNVLTNDTDIENDTLTVTEFVIDGDATVYSAGDTATIVNVGTLIINTNGSFTFTPAENYNGPVPHSTYVVSDGNGGSDTATLTFSDVSPVNDAPVANADNSITVTEDTVASGNVLTNDSDPDGDIITVTQFIVAGDATTYSAGDTATISGVGSLLINANGTYTFTPEANYNGVIPSVTYTITDGSLTDSAVLNFNNITSVDDAPEAADDGAYSVTEDEASIGNVLTNDTDIENDTLTVTEFVIDGDATVYSAGDTATIVNVGTLIINANGSFTFTPAENYNGPVPHSTYVVSDGNGGSDTATLTFSDVSPVNDAPVANADNSITVTEDTVASGNVLTNDSDPDGDIITVTQFIVAGDATTYSAGDTATISGVGSLLINANGTYTFTPETNYDGAIPDVTYTITDGSLTDSAVLNFNNITSVDDAPEAADDGAYSVTEDEASIGNVLTNDTDIENDTLTVTEFVIDGDATVYSAGDTATIVNVGTLIINANGSFTFTPAENYNGPVPHSTYVVSDGNGGSDTATLTFSDVSPVNDAPVANADNSITVTEDTVASGNVLTNDSDPDGDIITVTQFIVAGDATTYSAGDTATISGVGSLLINANGTYTFTPETNYDGAIPDVTYTITDGSLTDSAVLNFNNITSVDDAPEAADDGIYSVTEDTASTGNVLTNDTDVENDTLTVTEFVIDGDATVYSAGDTATIVNVGTLIINTNGDFVFTPANDYNGPVPHSTYVVSDGNGGFDTAQLSFSDVTPVVDIVSDALFTGEDTPVSLNVLANDNFEGSPLVTSFTQGSNGTVTLNSDGTGSYTPNNNFSGTDSFSYTVTSGEVTETTTVTVSVNEQNDAPQAETITDQNAVDGQAVSIDISELFSDPDADTLTFSITGLPTGLSIDGSTGIISGTIDHSASQNGPTSNGIYNITVTAADGRGGSVDGSFDYTIVNALPTAVNDAVTTIEDTTTTINVLANDADPDNDTLTVTEAVAGNGTVVINANNTITYTPAADFNGTDTIIYRIDDGEGGESTASVNITVTSVNDDPTTSGIDDQSDADSSTINLDVSANFSDVDGDDLSFSVSGLPTGLTIDSATGVITGTVSNNVSSTGPYSVTITADDGNGGSVDTSFTWAFENIPPIADDDFATTAEDTFVIISVLDNDTDPDGDPLSVVEASAANGTIVINDGNTITYTPDADFTGTDVINYRITDGNSGFSTATVTVTVTAANDAPIVNSPLPDEAAIDGQAVSIDFAPFFSDVDGDTLNFSVTGLPVGLSIDPTTGVVSGTFASDASQSSPYTITITADDANGGTVSDTFSWSVANPPLQANPDTNTVLENGTLNVIAGSGILTNDSDPDGDTLNVAEVEGSTINVGQAVTGSNGGSFIVNDDGSYSFDSGTDFDDLAAGVTRTTSVIYQASDGEGGLSSATLTVTVTGVNDNPIATGDSQTTNEDTAVSGRVNATDAEGDSLTFTLATNPGNGTATVNADGTYLYTPAPDFNGTDTFTVTVEDGNGGSDTETVTINVTPVDDAPVAVDDGPFTVTEDTPVSGTVIGNDTDIDGDTLTVTQFWIDGDGTIYNADSTATITGVGTLQINSDGSFTFTPAENYNGPVPSSSYTISDGNGGFDTGELSFNDVSAVNDGPVANDDGPIEVIEDTTRNGSLFGNDSDVEGDTIAVTQFVIDGDTTIYSAGDIATISGVGTLMINATGSYSFVPDADYNGAIPSATYTISDGNGGSDTAILSFSDVTPVDDAPVAVDDGPISVTEDTPVSGAVITNDTDIDGDTLTVTQFWIDGDGTIYNADSTATITGVGTLQINSDGSFTFTPAENYNGPVPSSSYTISDGNGGFDTGELSFNDVSAVNDGPVANDDGPIEVIEDTTRNGSLFGNDSDVEGDTIAVTQFVIDGDSTVYNPGQVVTISGVGTLMINATGSYSFVPEANYNGAIPSATYTISDGNGGSDTAILSFSDVTPVDDAPVAVDDGPISVIEDTPVSGTVITNDTDIDGDTLTVTQFSVNGDGTIYSAGTTATITGVGSFLINTDGSFTFTPAENYNGPVPSSSYTISDGNGGFDTGELSFNDVSAVNDGPVANDDGPIEVIEDTTRNGSLFGNDSDVEGDTVAVTQFVIDGDSTVYNPGQVATISGVGTLMINATGSYSFVPEANYNGAIPSATYTISDGNGGSDTAILSFSDVTPVDDEPVAVDDGPISVTEDTAVSGTVIGNDTDIDGDTLTVTQFSIDGHGEIYNAGDLATISGIGSFLINSDGSFTFTPAENYNGPVPSSSYTISDGNGGFDTGELSFNDVSAVNDGPVANDDGPIEVIEDTTRNGSLFGNDSDVEGDTIAVTQFVIDGDSTVYNPGQVATISGVGTLMINATGSYSFVPEANYNGAIPSATYTISDGNGGSDTAILSFSDVTPVDDEPVAVDDGPISVTEDTAVSGTVIGNDTDIDGDTLTVTQFSIDGHGEIYNAGDLATISGIGSFLINSDGSFTFTPAENYNGPVPSSSYTISDGNGGFDTGELSFNDVSAVNDGPVANDDGPIEVIEDTTRNGSLFGNDSDVEGDTIAVTQFVIDGDSTVYNPGQVATISGVGTLMINATGSYSFVPEANYNGAIPSATYTISDGNGGSDTAILSFSDVTPVDDAPVAVDDGPISVTEDTAVSGTVIGNDTDIDGDTLTVTQFSIDGHGEIYNAGDLATISGIGSFLINSDGSFTFTPAENYNGPVPSSSYTISDGNGGFDTGELSFNDVSAVNDGPVANDDGPIEVIEDTTRNGSLFGNDSDVEGDTIAVTQFVIDGDSTVYNPGQVATISGVGTLMINATGSYSFVPDADYNGAIPSATYTISDGNGGSDTAILSFSDVTPVDDAPVAVDDGPISVTEDTAVSGTVIGNDTDIDGDTLTVTQFSVNGDGTIYSAGTTATITGVGSFLINTDGSFTFTPAENYNGPVPSSSYTISDGNGGFDTGELSFNDVIAVNDAPVANDDGPIEVIEDTTRNGSLFGNDSDVEGDTIAVTQFVIEGDSTVYTPGQVATISGVGTLMINGTGSYSFVPDADYNGAIPNATYTIDDGNGGTDTAILAFSNISLVIDITPDNLSTNEDTSVLLDVLANDSFEASPLVTEFTQSTNGIVTLEADGTGSYTPNENFFGSDSFTYTVTSGGVTETTTVTINIIEQNDIPESVGIADQSAVDGQTVSIDLSNRFSDVDADDLTFSSTVLPSGLSIDPTTGVISGTLDNSASQHGPTNNGIYEVSITALDGRGGSAEETFTYTIVNALPTAVNDDVVTEEDTSATINVLVNDGNPDSDSLTVTEAVAAHGTLVINFDNSITYTPDIDFNGSDTIIYRIIDGDGGESTASVNVTVTPANDDPTSSGIANQADADSSSINLDVSANFSDIDGDDLSFSVAGLPPGLSIDAVTGVITGTVPNDVSITGPYTVTVTADDGNGGSVDTSFTWAFENIPPIADDDFATTAEDTFVIISVLDNDTDPDGDPLSVVEASAANGTIVINGGNTITYTPDADFIGTDSINYRISDGAGSFSTATVTVTVTPANDAPIVNTPLPAEAAIDGQTVSINFSPYFSDVDGDTLSFTATGLPSGISIDANTGVVSGTFENNASVSSPYNITITASDDSGATVSESFDWSVANPPLQANPDVKDVFENATITVTATDGVLNNDLDPDGDSLTVSAVENNTVNVGQAVAGSNGGTFVINADGSYSFNASTDFDDLPEAGSRTTSIIYQASDGEGGLSTATLTLTVTGGNDDPIASADNPTTDEDLAVNGVVSATDTEADTLTFALTAAPTNGTVIVNADGSYVYTPNDNFNGTDTFTVTVEDGNGGSDIATVTVDVASINDAPVIVGDSQTTNEDTSVTGTVTATDIDNDPLNLSVTTEANNGNVILDPSGSYTYTPNADFNGTDSFAITVDDGNGGTNTVVVNINVSADNDAPTASTLIIGNVNDSEIVNIDTRSAFDDIDGDTLTYSANGLPDELSINTNTGQITGTLSNNASQSSPYNVTVTSNDGKGGEVSTTFTLTVNNIAPVAQDDVFTGDEDQVITGNLRSNDNDPDNDITSIDTTPVSGPSQGTVILSSDGSFTYTPNADANGTDSFTYRLIDSNGESSEATVTFVTTAVNDIPVVLNDTVQTDEDTPITINVLANDIDVDGDALNVISVDGQPTLVGRMVLLISGDSVVLNADGTLTFTPAHNTNGETSFEYQVIDAEGERVTGTVNISVTAIPDSTDINQSLEIGQQEISTVQIFEAEATETTPSDDRFISAPGIVLETVFDVRDLHSTVNLTAGAPIQTAVNDLQSLNSNENLLQVEHPILEAMRNLDNFSLFNQRITEIFDADINPFESDSDKLEDDDQEINSLLIPAGDSANNKTTEELSIETIVRNQALLMSVRSMANNSESTIINYNVTRVDGRALPDWISLDNKGLALLEAPEQMKDIQLNIHAIDASGISTIYPVELDLFSGKIAQLDFPEQVDIDTFDNRISQEAYGSSVETAALMQALNTTRFQ